MQTHPGIGRWLSGAVLAAASSGIVASPALAQSASSAAAVAGSAQAQPGAAELNEQGLALYAARDYRHALEKFIGARVLERDPNLLFNIGRCYEQLGEREAALEKYRQFLAEPGAAAAGVERARASIDALLAQRRREAPAPASAGPQPARPAAAPPASAARASPTDWRPWLTLGGTVVFAAAGATCYALGARDHAQVTNLPEYGHPELPAPMTWRQADALVHSGNTKKVAGGVMLGLSGGLAAATVALFLAEDREAPPESSVALKPTALRGGGGLLLAGSFR